MLVLFIVGLLSSFIASLVGLGGGFILVPVLTLALHFNIKDAIFLSICSILFLSILNNLRNRELLSTHRPLVKSLALYCIVGAVGSSYLSVKLSSQLIQQIFSVVMIVFAAWYVMDKGGLQEEDLEVEHRSPYVKWLFLISGVLSGLLGLGGGVINVPILNRLLHFKMSNAVKISFAFVLISSATSFMTHFQLRKDEIHNIPFMHLIMLLAGTYLGSRFSSRIQLPQKRIRLVFCFVLVGVALFKLYRSFV